jgi:hypothetical protein
VSHCESRASARALHARLDALHDTRTVELRDRREDLYVRLPVSVVASIPSPMDTTGDA